MNDRDTQLLGGRLNAGWVMIDAEPDDAKRARLEDHWVDLLHQYEEAWDRAEMAQGGIAA